MSDVNFGTEQVGSALDDPGFEVVVVTSQSLLSVGERLMTAREGDNIDVFTGGSLVFDD